LRHRFTGCGYSAAGSRSQPTTAGLANLKPEDKVTVCDACLQASCWQGIFMCDEARDAGIVVKTVAELRELKLENEDYWR
jgi:hypothetical protein